MTEITLTHGDAQATIALLGAEARSWRVAGRDLLWPGDPAIWNDISPILYPVVGWTRDGEERVDGVRYPLGLHGFARFETFTIESSAPGFVRLTLSDNARTRALYPFAFALALEYRLSVSHRTADHLQHFRSCGLMLHCTRSRNSIGDSRSLV